LTDVVAVSLDGAEVVPKLLSESPEHYDDAALEAIGRILNSHGANVSDVAEIRMGTTIPTNALLERNGESVAFVVKAGFGDTLEIDVQARPRTFALGIRNPDRTHNRVI
jgi:5-oxoprolinase (ATP-hydrolysing)